MNFVEHYFSESKNKKKRRKKKKVPRKISVASYFNSKKYDKKVSGTLDLNLIGL
ncbi:MAG: hypothetical protein ACOC80_15545 [Petrotogales bacterium]